MRHTTGDDFAPGGFLDQPGTYHLFITKSQEPATKYDGSILDGGLFKITVEAMAGTVEGQKGKTTELTFWAPKASDKDGGKLARKIIDRFLISIMLITEEQKGQDIDFDMNAAPLHRQFVAKLKLGNNDRLKIDRAEVYHVDDPAVANIPKDAAALKSLPPKFRLIGNRPEHPGQPAASIPNKDQQPRRGEKEASDLLDQI